MTGYHEKNYSQETAQKIDQEVKALIDAAHKRALDLLEENRDKVQLMADMLMEFETLDATDIKEMMDGSWNIEKKRERLKAADELQKINPPPPPPIPVANIIPEPAAKQDGMHPGLNS
jgi:cell division protease FtsH